jgi:hypothetical protein
LSGEQWAEFGEFLHVALDLLISIITGDPTSGLYIPQGTTLNVGWDVSISITSAAEHSEDEVYAIMNAGTINNNGSIIGGSSGNGALVNVGTINNYETGYLQFGALNTNIGIFNSGTSNNDGFLWGYADLWGIINNAGTINNEGVIQGDGNSTFIGLVMYSGQGIYNEGGTINNVGPVKGDSSWGEVGDQTGYLIFPYGIRNEGTINEYCDPTSLMLTYSSYSGWPPNPISCSTYQWVVYGIDGLLRPSIGAEVYLTLSWGPFVLPWTDAFYSGSYNEAFIGANANGSLTYSFPSHLSCSLPYLPTRNCPQVVSLYTCQSGCSGTVATSNDTLYYFYVTYSPPLAAPTISVSPTTIDSGQSATLSTSSSSSDGTPPYTCHWLEEVGTGGFSDFGSSFPCGPGGRPSESTGALKAGSYSFELQVTDNSSPAQVVTSNAVAVTVLSPAEMTQQLINTVNGMHLLGVTTAHLDPNLTAALNSLAGGNTNAAVSQLKAFIHYVNTQTPKKISQAQAQQLIAGAQATISAIYFCV